MYNCVCVYMCVQYTYQDSRVGLERIAHSVVRLERPPTAPVVPLGRL